MRYIGAYIARHMRFFLLFSLGVFLCSCTGYPVKPTLPKGVYHRIKAGDTLWNIAKAYHTSIQDLAEVNNITDPNSIEVGNVIFIPDVNYIVDDMMPSTGAEESNGDVVGKQKDIPGKAIQAKLEPGKAPIKAPAPVLHDIHVDKRKVSVKMPAPPETNVPVTEKKEVQKDIKASAQEAPYSIDAKMPTKQPPVQQVEKVKFQHDTAEPEKIKFDRDRFVWPVNGRVRSKFGIQPNGAYHNWVKISANEGASVFAAASGTVIFSDSFKDYGETIILKHEDHYATVYTNLNNRLVTKDAHIKKGSRIALLGKTDKGGDAYMNFEVRYKNKARNPLFFLP